MRVASLAAYLGRLLLRAGLCLVASQVIGAAEQARAEAPTPKPDPAALGYEIFHREWLPGDPRSHGGDGLGPVFNDSSCVACHNSGGSGGAGPASKNIDILSASASFNGRLPGSGAVPAPAPEALLEIHAGFKAGRTVVLHRFGIDPSYAQWRSRTLTGNEPPQFAVAVTLAPAIGFEPTTPVAVELDGPAGIETVPALEPPNPRQAFAAFNPRHSGKAPETRDGAPLRMAQIRQMVVDSARRGGQVSRPAGDFIVTRSQRNPTALFGLGLIDAIPDAVLETMAARQAKESPQIAGRVSRLKDGRLGRLGWKGQTANVEDFVLNACAVEVGLEVPGHAQALTPQAPRYMPPGLDLTGAECAALVAYVRSLPRPMERPASGGEEAKVLDAGKETFARIGCAGCHTAQLGDVEGIYSDLLLHDMGPEMSESGSYGDSSGDPDDELLPPVVARNIGAQGPPPVGQGEPPGLGVPPGRESSRALGGARRQEWRTPPLWGFRDSSPYLHDGRAQSLEEAVAMHGGQGSAAAATFFALTPRERVSVEAFLKSLVAPMADRLRRAGD